MQSICKNIQILLAMITLMGANWALAQVSDLDPLGTARELIHEQEIILTYTELSSTNNSGTIYGMGYDPTNSSLPLVRSWISSSEAGKRPDLVGATATVAGSFLGEQTGEGIARAYIGEDGINHAVYFMIEFYDKFDDNAGFLAANTELFKGGSVFTPSGNQQQPDLDLVAGNFDLDPEEELAIIYNAADNKVKVDFYDITINQLVGSYISVDPVLITSLNVRTTAYNSEIYKGLAGAAVDMNSDGVDELAIVSAGTVGSSIDFRIFERKENGLISLRGNPSTLFALQYDPCTQTNNYNYSNLSLDIASGEMTAELPGEELVVVAHFGLDPGVGSPGNNGGLYVFPLGSVIYPNTGIQAYYTTWCQGGAPYYYTNDEFIPRDEEIAIDVATGDLDGDLDAEVVVGTSSKVFYFDASTQVGGAYRYMRFNALGSFNLTSAYTNNQIGGEAKFADDFLDVGNIDPLTGNFGSNFRAEILVGKNFPLVSDPINQDLSQRFELTVYGFNESGAQGAVDFSTPVVRAQNTNIRPVSNGFKPRHFSVIMADVDGGSVRLGNPRRTEVSEVLNPSIVLNAPPTHFDVLGSNVYDVSNLYATGEPAPPPSVNHFFANYEQINNQALSFSTQFTADWAVSAEVKAGLDLSGFSLGARMSQTYGERFSKLQESTSEQTIVQSRSALNDDELLAYLVDYTVFEYPVFRQGESEEFSHVVVVLPSDIKETFIGARNPIHNYRPSHQHGNLFSYPSDASELDVFPQANQIYTDALKSQSLNKTSGFNTRFSITQLEASTQSLETEITTQTMVGVNAGGAFKGVGLSVDVEGNYATSNLQNSTLSYREQVTLACYLGQGEQQSIPGDYPYTITPLVYWDAGGALVLDYLVDIDKFEFWQDNYDSYDPAFLLLNPHKIEKGIESPQTYNRSDRYRTRDIYFDQRPKPGENVEIFARIFNYGFEAIPADTLDVAFYYLDPLAGDSLVLIASERVFFGFEGRDNGLGKNTVSTTWAVPGSVSTETKVVAIIDPEDKLTEEIHDYPLGNGISNNVGWTCAFVANCQAPSSPEVLFPAGAATSVTEKVSSKVNVYPNPFSDQVTLDFELSQGSSVQLRVLTLQGQVLHEESKPLSAGVHSLEVQSSDWPAGIYLYQLISEEAQATGKILLRR